MTNKIIEILKNRGVTIRDISECVYFLQSKYYDDLTLEYCDKIVMSVLEKREVIHAVLTGVAMDEMVDKKLIQGDLYDILVKDEPLYGLDEVLAYGICNLYGSIALTNFGFIDRTKPLIIGKLNLDKSQCNTYLDDIVGAIAASAASKIAHNR